MKKIILLLLLLASVVFVQAKSKYPDNVDFNSPECFATTHNSAAIRIYDSQELETDPCDSMLLTKDTLIFPGEPVTLKGHGMFSYYWTPAFLNPEDSIQEVHPTKTTTYYLTGYYQEGNAVYNGDFELGNTGFGTDYKYVTSSMGYGRYAINTDGLNVWNSGGHVYGHGGKGKFMIVDGADHPNAIVWTQTVNVYPNTTYAFSAEVVSMLNSYINGRQALLQFSINGVQVGDIFHAPSTLGNWVRYYEIWESGNATTATISILNQNADGTGNDFGLDDISFCPIVPCEDSVTVEVFVKLKARNDTVVVCVGNPVSFNPVDNDSIPHQCGTLYPHIVDSPSNASEVSENGATLTIGYDRGFNGIDSMTYSICYGEYCDTATVYLLVSGSYESYMDTICAGSPYHLHGFDIPAEQTLVPGPANFDTTYLTQLGCDSIVELFLQILENPYTEVSYSSCDSFRWNDELITESGDYTQTLQAENGCDSNVLAHVTIEHCATIIDLDVCQSSEPFSYDRFNNIDISQEGSFQIDSVFVSSFGCDSFVTLNIHVHPVRENNIVEIACESFVWNNIVYTESGSYSQTLQTIYGCDSTVYLDLTVVNLEAEIIQLDEFCDDYQSELSVSSNAANLLWNTGEQTQNIVVTKPGNYSVVASDLGCEVTADIDVERCELRIFLPNAITANGDGLNDDFHLMPNVQNQLEHVEIYIYNRFGQQVFYSDDINFKWDGSYKGKIFHDTVYSYQLRCVPKDGPIAYFTGSITVL